MKLKLPLALSAFATNKTWLVLGIALAIGLLAALAARSYLFSQLADIEARGKGRMVDVVVAKTDLAKGDRLSADNLAVRPIPADYAHSLALKPEQFERVEGRVLAYQVKGGEAILWGLLEGSKVPTFSARVAAGHRAITVPVDEINSISGLLEPGDLIDLVVTLEHKGRKRSLPLLQGVEVMATGQRSVDDLRGGEPRMYSTVTLDTDPQQAQNIIVAREAGKLTALLRNPQDTSRLPGGTADLAAWLGGRDRLAGDEVPVLYGGRGAKLPPEGLRLSELFKPSSTAAWSAQVAREANDSVGATQVLVGRTAGTPVP